MADTLSEFLKAASRRSFSLGSWDCGAFTAAWVEQVRGVDPGVEWRDRYRTTLGLARIIKRRGGMVEHFDACLAPLDIKRTDEPKRGDIAIVAGAGGETAGIVLGTTVALIPLNGPGLITRHLSAAQILAAWSVGYAVTR